MNEELLLNIREKGQYETYTEHFDSINKEIEKHNQIVMKYFMTKNSEISELKSEISELKTKIANLEAEKAKAEKSQLDSRLINVVNDLKSNIKLLKDFANKNSEDVKIDVLISKSSELMDVIYKLNSEFKEIKAELSKPVNLGGIQEYIHRQTEIEEEIKDIHEIVSNLNKTVDDVVNNRQTNSLNINNMEQAVSLLSDQQVQEPNYIPDAKPITEQMNNYENSLSNEQEVANEEENQEQQEEIENVNPFAQVLNSEEPVQEEVNQEPSIDNQENESQDSVVSNVVPFVNNQETIAPDASVINSIIPQENVEEETKDDSNNVIEETNNTEEVTENAPVPEDAQKVENVEEAPQETIAQAQQRTELSARDTRTKRVFINKSNESDSIEKIFNEKTGLLNKVEVSDEVDDYFKAATQTETQEQGKVR